MIMMEIKRSSKPEKIDSELLTFEVSKIRNDFPILSTKINGQKLVYADSAATTQKPLAVIERMSNFYSKENANVHRGVHTLSENATEVFENGREIIRSFLNASKRQEIIFTKGTTEAINLVAQSYARNEIKTEDEILITTLEHHSNIVPWQIICQQTGAKLKVAPINNLGELDIDAYQKLLSKKTKLVALTHISNALGTINPIRQLTAMAKDAGALVLIDGAQGSIHEALDVQKIGCDFYAFSGHKALGPTGIGVLYGKIDLLDKMPPWQSGGDMIKTVSFSETIYNDVPYKFEAGTPNISGVLGLSTAIEYFSSMNLDLLIAHEKRLLDRATKRALEIPNLTLVGKAKNKAVVCSFIVKDIHSHDLGTLLDQQGVAIRTGHHCAMPLMSRLGLSGTARASFAFYNTLEDVDTVFDSVQRAVDILLG